MSQFGFCALSIMPVRAEASERSEMVNQLLFGELYHVIDEFDGWVVVRSSHDNYEGFIDRKQWLRISEKEYKHLHAAKRVFPKELVAKVTETTYKNTFNILFGSSLPGYAEGAIRVGDREYQYDGEFTIPDKNKNRTELVSTAKKYMGAPYLWGGRSPFGIDCSGFMQVVFNIHGISINRDASYQARQGRTLNLVSEAMPGDLAFFDNDEGQITHVGMFIEDEKIIHASGHVRIDKIDHQGIFNEESGKYTHKLRLIKKVVEGDNA